LSEREGWRLHHASESLSETLFLPFPLEQGILPEEEKAPERSIESKGRKNVNKT